MNTTTTDEALPADLVYPRERTLERITLIFGVLLWLALIVGTVGVALIFILVGVIAYLFAHSALIARLKGNGVELSREQFPELFAEFERCCKQLDMGDLPSAYILNGNGVLNAFATKFLRDRYIVLMSDIVDAVQGNPDALRFYIGHELGHLRMKHISKAIVRWPVLWVPLLGAAYSRARESTCDRHGLACSGSRTTATQALGVLAAGRARWRTLSVPTYVHQTHHSGGFWMSFHELISGYPWLTKRAARMVNEHTETPHRNPFAYFFALFVPFAGRLGGGFSFLIMVYIIGLLAAVAIPAYHDYTIRAKLTVVEAQSAPVRAKLVEFYQSNHRIPDTLQSAGINSTLADGSSLSLDPRGMKLIVATKHGQLIFVPSDAGGRIVWFCTNGEGIKPAQLPMSCRPPATR